MSAHRRRLATVLLLAAMPFVAGCGPRDVQTDGALLGHWQGHVAYRDATLDVELDVAREHGTPVARLTAPALLLRHVRVGDWRFSPPRLHFVMPVGDDAWTFDGWLRRSLIVGSFSAPGLPDSGHRALQPQLALRRAPPAARTWSEDTVRFAGSGVSLAGTVLSPLTAGPHPALVMLHNSDQGSRAAYVELASRFARAGFVVLAWDRRGAGASSGDPEASFDDMHVDAVAALRFLRARPGVDSSRTGVWGHSIGGLLAPGVAAEGGGAFVIAISPPGLTLRRMFAWQDSIAGRVSDGRPGPRWYESAKDRDPLAPWRELRLPALVFYGERDDALPGAACASLVRGALAAGPSRDASVRLLPRADHGMQLRWQPGEPFTFPVEAPGYADTLVAWLQRHASNAAAVRAR